MKKLFVIMSISLMMSFSLLVISCDLFDLDDIIEDGNFWAINVRNAIPYRINADLIYKGTYCTVWAERGSGVDTTAAKQLADKYDNEIYNMMIDAFSIKDFTYRNINFSNIMEFADWLGDGDGKLCILMLDIKDNYKAGVNESYVAGYFRSYDFISEAYSNKRDMIYIDTNPGFVGEKKEKAYETVAHEMQHMMNYVTSVATRSEPMDLWIDEGLSSAAEWLYEGEHSEDRYRWINLDPSGLIKKGNNFFVWGNRNSEHNYAINDEYYTVYLFFQWLRIQSDDGESIYKNIISSSYSDYRAVTNSAYNHDSNWETLLGDWLAANYINAPTGRYGYLDDSVLKKVKAPFSAETKTSISLYPGEGVYSIANSYTIPSSLSGNIKYAGLNDTTLIPSGTVTGALLTFNANSSRKGNTETGTITGVKPPDPKASMLIDAFSASSSVQDSLLSGPYPIGIGDALRGNGYEYPVFDFSGNVRGAGINE